jgi:hypothetical protein
MPAKFQIIKYTGKSSDFGTEVSSIGLKRVDAAVPAVYGTPVVPGDDRSDASTYSVYRPDSVDGISYSFESIFKLKLATAPDNQLSNVRIYTSTVSEISVTITVGTGLLEPGDRVVGVTSNAIGTVMNKTATGDIMNLNVTSGAFVNNEIITTATANTATITSIETITGTNASDTDESLSPVVCIGTNQSYTIPTNIQSAVATVNLLSYTAENPFMVPVGGIVGTEIDPDIALSVFNLTLNDIGAGNVIYVNNVRQDELQVVGDSDRVYTLLDQTDNSIQYALYPADAILGDAPILTTATPATVDVDLRSGVDGNLRAFIEITSTTALEVLYPNGFVYAKYDVVDFPTFDDAMETGTLSVGGVIDWVDIDGDPIEIISYEVTVQDGSYYLDDVRQPSLNFELNRIYEFVNTAGDTDPIRFIDSTAAPIAVEDVMVFDGVSVVNGGTVDEVVTVDARAVFNAGKEILCYQSTTNQSYGGKVENLQFEYTGNYNINTVGGGTNPAAAGETDYIYLQLQVKGNDRVGNFVPDVIIEYDEN